MKKSKKNAPKVSSKNSTENSRYDDALIYHQYASLDKARVLPGKIEVVPTKACSTQRDLSLAYTPGVASPSLEIAKDPSKASLYTARSNLVAVVTNGTAVLGLGNVGPLAAKPVMEGKAVLFKKFANVDVFDIELNAPSPEEVINACKMLEPTFGGINLEDIKAPDCFQVEEELRRTLKIPVFHDDQHGTAIIVAAAFLNAIKLAKKKPSDLKIVFSGAGAAALACARMLLEFGVKKEQVILCDNKGVVHHTRPELDKYKKEFATKIKARTIAEALKGADVLIGLSVGGVISRAMIKGMAKNPIIFALANPTPEIAYDDAVAERPDAIVATGRSDYPNQINNVLGFPYIFRGALDVEASSISKEMNLAAAKALAMLAQEPVPDSVSRAYGGKHFSFGKHYLIPKPFDPRALLWVAPAVAEAAIKSGVARKKIEIKAYRESLAQLMDRARPLMSIAVAKAQKKLTKIILPEAFHPKILKAAKILVDERIAEPILLGDPQEIKSVLKTIPLEFPGIHIINPATDPLRAKFTEKYFKMRQRKGLSALEAERELHRKTVFGLMMLQEKMADAFVSGVTKSYPETIRPALRIIPRRETSKTVAGVYLVLARDHYYFLADTTVNITPSAEQLAEIAILTSEWAKFFGIEPRIAFLNFSNFGSSHDESNERIYEALEILKKRRPDLAAEGELQADTAIVPELLARYPFANLKAPANVLVFPNLAAGNIAYKLLQRLGNAQVIGPILMGLEHPVHILQQDCSVEEIVNICTIAAAEANQQNHG